MSLVSLAEALAAVLAEFTHPYRAGDGEHCCVCNRPEDHPLHSTPELVARAAEPAEVGVPWRCPCCGTWRVPRPACGCGHLDVDHDLGTGKRSRVRGACSVGGCGCDAFVQVEPTP